LITKYYMYYMGDSYFIKLQHALYKLIGLLENFPLAIYTNSELLY